MTRSKALPRTVAGAAGAMSIGGGFTALRAQARREVSVGGRRIKVIDIHCHGVIDVSDIVKGTPLAKQGAAGNQALGPQRLALMDKTGVDVQALTINGFWWYEAERDLASRIVQAQNEGLAKWVSSTTRIASSRWPRWRCNIPISRRSSSKTASSVSGCAARRSAGTSTERICRCRSTIPSGPRPPSSACPVVMHPGGADNIIKDGALRGRGDLGNIIGNPLETTLLPHAIDFRWDLRQVPGLACVRGARGWLPAVISGPHGSRVRRSRQRQLREQAKAQRVS